jgi:hypothetical protein
VGRAVCDPRYGHVTHAQETTSTSEGLQRTGGLGVSSALAVHAAAPSPAHAAGIAVHTPTGSRGAPPLFTTHSSFAAQWGAGARASQVRCAAGGSTSARGAGDDVAHADGVSSPAKTMSGAPR